MHFRERLGTYSLVTVVAVLIWLWAAAETRGQRPALFRVQLAPASPADQVVTPGELTAEVTMTGSQLALQQAAELASRTPLTLTVGNELPSQIGVHRTSLVEALEKNDAITRTGVGILSVDPATIDLTIDALVPITLPVRPVLPGIEVEGEVEVIPPAA